MSKKNVILEAAKLGYDINSETNEHLVRMDDGRTLGEHIKAFNPNAQENIIESVQKNGESIPIINKNVDISVPTGLLAEKDNINNSDMVSMNPNTIKGRKDTGGHPQDLCATEVREILNVADGATSNTGTVTGITQGSGISVTPSATSPTVSIAPGGIGNAHVSEAAEIAQSKIANLTTDLGNRILTSARGSANGVASLDTNVKVPMSQLPDVILGALIFGGNFVPATSVGTLNADSQAKLETTDTTITFTNNTAAITGYGSNKGIYYIATADGSHSGTGNQNFAVGDWVVSTGVAWVRVANTDAVTGVKGDSESTFRLGNVNVTKENIGLGNVDDTSDINKPISSAAQTALNNKAQVGSASATDGQAVTGITLSASGVPTVTSVPIPAPTSVENVLTSTNSTSALSANMGRELDTTKQNFITATGTSNLLTAPETAGGQPGIVAQSAFANANASLSAETGTGIDTATPAISLTGIISVLQSIWSKVRQVGNVASAANTAANDAVKFTSNQGLDSTQQANARANIGVGSSSGTITGVTTGNGLTGGGALGNVTVSLGAPNSSSPSTGNTVTDTSHTHTITGVATSAQGTLATNAVRNVSAGTGQANGNARISVTTGENTPTNVDLPVAGWDTKEPAFAVLPITKGGTGQNTAAAAYNALGGRVWMYNNPASSAFIRISIDAAYFSTRDLLSIWIGAANARSSVFQFPDPSSDIINWISGNFPLNWWRESNNSFIIQTGSWLGIKVERVVGNGIVTFTHLSASEGTPCTIRDLRHLNEAPINVALLATTNTDTDISTGSVASEPITSLFQRIWNKFRSMANAKAQIGTSATITAGHVVTGITLNASGVPTVTSVALPVVPGLATTSANGLLRQLNNNANQFINGQGNWATPPSGIPSGGITWGQLAGRG
jgi:hypothetical protein